MKYYVGVNGEEIEIELEEQGDHLVARLGEETLTLDLRQVQPALYSLLVENRSHELLIEEQEGVYTVLIDGELFHVSVQDEWARRLASIQRKQGTAAGDLAVKAPMPGVVIDVLVAPGQTVTAGQGLVILAAMKMENEIRAPRDGTVKTVSVERGQTVEHGQTLVVLR